METTQKTIQIVGYGSLLLEESARKSVPSLTGFRLVRVPNYIRIFNKVGIVFHTRRNIDPADLRRASCASRLRGGAEIWCTTFECPSEEFPELFEREHRFKWVDVEFEELGGGFGRGIMCTEWTDDEYRTHRIKDDADYFNRVGRFYQGKLWRDDILPFPEYLQLCLDAAGSHSEKLVTHFLQSSYLADGVTTLERYLQTHPNALRAE
ncbi:MAG: gamma-glutamylcyclotransferase [Anaerolineae bacterium]